jgi:hypothetical protein
MIKINLCKGYIDSSGLQEETLANWEYEQMDLEALEGELTKYMRDVDI